MRTLLFLLCTALIVPALPHTAQAQKRGISQKDRREAKRLFNQAHLAYRRGDYEEAILRWQESYELSQEPLIFLSIANAYERLGNSAQTLENLKRWREKAPRREHEELDGRIERLEVRVRAEKDKEEKRQEEETRLAAQLAAQQAAAGDDDDDTPPTEGEDGEIAVWPIVGWSLVGVGGAAIITGLIVDAVAASTRPAEDEACLTRGDRLLCSENQGADIDSSNTMAIAGDITWIAGTALAAGGVVVLLTLARDDGDEAEATASDAGTVLLPVLTPNAAGVLLTATF